MIQRGQVPEMKAPLTYLIIGNGNIARHFSHYFSLKQIKFNKWSRSECHISELQTLSKSSDIILLLISDDAIESFVQENPFLKEKTLIHFSGSLVTPLAYGAHPLMSFSEQLYELPTYESISFVVEKNSKFMTYFPDLKNPNFEIEKSQKALYHTLCVLSGNFSVLLWQKAMHDFQTKLALPSQILIPYLKQITHNLTTNPETALTGPLARRDTKTLKKNLASLKSDPYYNVYLSFVQSVDPELTKELI